MTQILVDSSLRSISASSAPPKWQSVFILAHLEIERNPRRVGHIAKPNILKNVPSIVPGCLVLEQGLSSLGIFERTKDLEELRKERKKFIGWRDDSGLVSKGRLDFGQAGHPK